MKLSRNRSKETYEASHRKFEVSEKCPLYWNLTFLTVTWQFSVKCMLLDFSNLCKAFAYLLCNLSRINIYYFISNALYAKRVLKVN